VGRLLVLKRGDGPSSQLPDQIVDQPLPLIFASERQQILTL
jgi:hypothetical protein